MATSARCKHSRPWPWSTQFNVDLTRHLARYHYRCQPASCPVLSVPRSRRPPHLAGPVPGKTAPDANSSVSSSDSPAAVETFLPTPSPVTLLLCYCLRTTSQLLHEHSSRDDEGDDDLGDDHHRHPFISSSIHPPTHPSTPPNLPVDARPRWLPQPSSPHARHHTLVISVVSKCLPPPSVKKGHTPSTSIRTTARSGHVRRVTSFNPHDGARDDNPLASHCDWEKTTARGRQLANLQSPSRHV